MQATNRNHAIEAWQNVMDELARISREIHLINRLIIASARSDTQSTRTLAAIKRRLEDERARLQRMQDLLSKDIAR